MKSYWLIASKKIEDSVSATGHCIFWPTVSREEPSQLSRSGGSTRSRCTALRPGGLPVVWASEWTFSLVDRQALLRAYAAEQKSEIRAEVAKLLGETKATFAVDALISHLPGHKLTAAEKEFRATIEKGLGPGVITSSVDTDIRSLFEGIPPKQTQVEAEEGYWTVWALGMIGDGRATEPIIAAARDNSNWSSVCYGALGRIGSEEAINFLIVRLHDPGAVRALGKARSKKAIPALKRLHTELITASDRNGRDKGISSSRPFADIQEPSRLLDGIRIALIQIEDPNPVDALLCIAETRNAPEYTRAEAVEGLEPLDISDSLDRIVRLCQSNTDNSDGSSIWLASARLLAGRRDRGVTNALIRLLNGPTPRDKTGSFAVCIMSHAMEISRGTSGAMLDEKSRSSRRNSDK